jgi:predicted dehydrogenase
MEMLHATHAARRQLRLAILGCGAITEMAHIPAARGLDEACLTGLVDTNLAHAQALAARYGIPLAAAKLDDVMGQVDAIILATPPHVRPGLARQAFGAGLHVLCEKPLANTTAECKIILESAKQSNRTLAVAHTARFFPNRIHVHTLLQRECLGKITTVDVEQGDPYDWPTRTGYTVRQDLVRGGVLLNEGIHSLDTLFWWFGMPLDFEYEDDSLGGIESNARIKMTFTGDITGKFRLSRTCKLANQITIEGDAGKLSIPLYNQAQIFLTRGGHMVTQRLASCDWDFVGIVAEQLRDFVFSIEAAKTPRVTGDEGLRLIEFIEKCYAVKRQRPLPKRAPIPGLTW